MTATDWVELAVNGLPTGTVTLLLADIEGSTRLWETQSDVMTDTVGRLDKVLADACMQHNGVRPVEQGEGDSFVIAFARAADAVACALALQRAPLAPIKLRIGLHTGDIQLRDEGNYIGPTINRTARLRDLGHGGQTVLSGVTESLILDQLPPDATLAELGNHPLRDLPRPERVIQLCHPDLPTEFPPLRTSSTAVVKQHLPLQLTSFVGRRAELTAVQELVTSNRLVTLAGAGGIGKTRLALEVAARLTDEFDGGVWNVDLAPVPHADVVPVAVARALGLPDQPGRATTETITRFIGDQPVLVILDNCEHLLDASAALVIELLDACRRLTLLTTSREPIGVAGETIWRVPSMSLADDAVALFADRARRVRPEFGVTEENSRAVGDICQRLDGLPLAIELAAARIRAMSLTELIASLNDRFRLLTGSTRMAVRRQQTLHASVDWSHALLTEPERVLFRRLSVFLGGFDLDAAQFICGTGDVERYQILDQLTLLVDKSLVVAEDSRYGTRYRLLETVRQYAVEKLGESGESDDTRSRHRDHYGAMAAQLGATDCTDLGARVVRTELEMDNLRIAFGWNLELADLERAQILASALQPLWLGRGRILEGRAWFDTAFTQGDPHRLALTPAAHARAKADKAVLDTWIDVAASIEQSHEALAIARNLDDQGLLAHVLTACGIASQAYDAEAARPYFAEAMELARAHGESWTLIQSLFWQAGMAIVAGDPIAARLAAEEGRELADGIGDYFTSRCCRGDIGWSMLMSGDVNGAVAQFDSVVAESEAVNSLILPNLLQGLACAHAHRGNVDDARIAAAASIAAGAEFGEYFEGMGYSAMVHATLAAGDVPAALTAAELAWRHFNIQPKAGAVQRAHNAAAAFAAGDLADARGWADEAAAATAGWNLLVALTTRIRVSIAEGKLDDAECDAHDALSRAARVGAHLSLPDILECLGELAGRRANHHEAVRLLGAADAMRGRMGAVRFDIYDAGLEAVIAGLRDGLGDNDFDAAWNDGAALSIEETIAYAQRGRGERKRPSTGWASLTPTELDVVKLVAEGLTNKDVAARLFISPRTVQAHLAHVFTKLGVGTRTQLAQEAARHG